MNKKQMMPRHISLTAENNESIKWVLLLKEVFFFNSIFNEHILCIRHCLGTVYNLGLIVFGRGKGV